MPEYGQPAPLIDEQRHEELHHLAAYAHNRPDVLQGLRAGLPEHEAAFLDLCVTIERGRDGARLGALIEIEDEKNQAREAAKLKRLEREAAERGHVRDRIKTWGEIKDYTPPTHLIQDVIYTGAVGVLLGDSQVGKTWVGVAIAASLATGSPWPGKPRWEGDGTPSAALYVPAEDGGAVVQRFKLWAAAHGRSLDAEGIVLDIHPSAVQLLDSVQVAELAEVVRERGYRLIVFDTVSASLAGEEEGNAEFALMVKHCRDLVQATQGNGAVMLVHHFGKDKAKGARGGSSLFANVDVVWELDGKLDEITMKNTKWKVDEKRKPWRLFLDTSDRGKVHVAVDRRPSSVDAAEDAADSKYRALSNAIIKVVTERAKENQGFGPARGVIKDCVNEMGIKFRDVELSQRLERMAADRVLLMSKRGVQTRYRLPGVQEQLPVEGAV